MNQVAYIECEGWWYHIPCTDLLLFAECSGQKQIRKYIFVILHINDGQSDPVLRKLWVLVRGYVFEGS